MNNLWVVIVDAIDCLVEDFIESNASVVTVTSEPTDTSNLMMTLLDNQVFAVTLELTFRTKSP